MINSCVNRAAGLLLFAVALLAAVASLKAGGPPKKADPVGEREWGPEQNGLRCAVALASKQKSVAVDEPVTVLLLTKNVGDKPVSVVGRPPLGVFKIRVLGPDGKPVLLTAYGRRELDIAGSGSRSVGKLAPGREEETRLLLSRVFDMTRAGEYKISFARFCFGMNKKPISVSSNDLSVTVVEEKIRVDQFGGLSEKQSNEACEQILKTHADLTADLMAQLQRKLSDEAKVYLIYLLGELRDPRAANLLTIHIDLKAPRLDPAVAIGRWSQYPAADALTKIGALGVREVSSWLPKDQTALRRKLMISVIWDVQGEKCGRILLEDALARQTTDAGKANMRASLEAFEVLRKSLQPR